MNTPNTSTERTKLRNTLLLNGYLPLPLADKGIFIKGWSRVQITEDWLKGFARSGRYGNTGLRCDELAAFDIDVLDEALADKCERYVENRAGETDLCRIGQWPKRLLLYAVEPATAEAIRSCRTGKYGGHMVEMLCRHGRQFAAFGIHPGTKKPYQWEDASPLTVPILELPIIPGELVMSIMEGLDKLLADTGLPRERAAHVRGGSSSDEYDMLPDTEVEFEGQRVLWGDLAPLLTSEGGFGNFGVESTMLGEIAAPYTTTQHMAVMILAPTISLTIAPIGTRYGGPNSPSYFHRHRTNATTRLCQRI